MDIIKKKMQPVEDMEQKANISASEQQKKCLEGVSERKEIKTQYIAKKQQTLYNATSPYGDTLSISEIGKTTSSLKGSKLVNNTADGTVIWKEAGSNEQEQETETSTINLSIYTDLELKQMYLDGDISRAEYDEEVNNRKI